MRHPASERPETIRAAEGFHPPAKQALNVPGIPRTTFGRWYQRCLEGELGALADRSPSPKPV